MPVNKPDADKISLRMENLWTQAESRVIQDIARRIRKNIEITSTADYQINRLIEMGKSSEEVEQILKETVNLSYPELYELYDNVANWQYVRNKDVYEQINRKFISPEDNDWMKQISDAVKKQTSDTLVNLAQSYGFTVMVGNNRVFTPFAEYYQKYVDSAIMDVISGNFDYNTVIRRTVSQMTNSGLRTVDYASGVSTRTPVAVRRAVLTGVSQITGKINEKNAALLGTDYYEVSWHSAARPDHREWQGRVYSYKELENVCGLGTVTGLCGANCGHEYYPFIPGVSERLYSDEWLEEQNQKEAETKEWMGKEYDAYGRTQKQRQMETAMRAQREKIDALAAGGADPDDIMLARAKYQAQLDEYGRFCKKMDLEQQRERIYYDMRGRVAPLNYNRNKKTLSSNSLRVEGGKIGTQSSQGIKNKKVNWGKMLEVSEADAVDMDKIHLDLLSHMINQKTEKSIVYSLTDKKILSSDIGNKIDEVILSKKTLQLLKKNPPNDIILSHVHPDDISFSRADIDKIVNYKSVKALTLECGNGAKYILDRCDYKTNILGYYKYDKIFIETEKEIQLKYPEFSSGDEKALEKIWSQYIDERNSVVARKLGMKYYKVISDEE